MIKQNDTDDVQKSGGFASCFCICLKELCCFFVSNSKNPTIEKK